MRSWRVGTVSMGSALLLLGVFLLVSTFTGVELNSVLMSWWPVILIILGFEILLFLFFRGKQELNLKYDVFSILFIGFLGTVAVSFAIVSSMGLTEKVSAAITSQEVTDDLPAFDEIISNDIERIVLETNQENLSIEGTNDHNLHIFGTFTQRVSTSEESIVNDSTDYVTVVERGDTLFVTVKDLPSGISWQQNDLPSMSTHILIPNNVELEVRSTRSNVNLRPRTISANWGVDGGNSVSLYVSEESDAVIEFIGVEQLLGDHDWEVTDNDEEVSQVDRQKIERMILGNGTHQFRLVNVYEVAVYKE